MHGMFYWPLMLSFRTKSESEVLYHKSLASECENRPSSWKSARAKHKEGNSAEVKAALLHLIGATVLLLLAVRVFPNP